jgi:hypothetical protein
MKHLFKLSFILTSFIFLNCSSRVGTAAKNNFEFHNDKESVILEIPTGNQFLELNKETRVNIKVNNIDPKTLDFSGQGIRFSPIQDLPNTISLEIKPTEESINDGKFSLMFSYPTADKIISDKFLIPIK